MLVLVAALLISCTFATLNPWSSDWDWNINQSPLWKQLQPFTSNDGICYSTDDSISASWSKYPYIAYFRDKHGLPCCSASILSLDPPHLLSAAGCYYCSAETGKVQIGPDIYTLDGFYQHYDYDINVASGLSYDIAIIILTEAIHTSGAQTVTIPPHDYPSVDAVHVVGYDLIHTLVAPSLISVTLKSTKENVMQISECAKIMKEAVNTEVDYTMICIRGGKEGEENVGTICSGGSPLISTLDDSNIVIGVLSWVLSGSSEPGCASCACCSGYPQVAAKIQEETIYYWMQQELVVNYPPNYSVWLGIASISVITAIFVCYIIIQCIRYNQTHSNMKLYGLVTNKAEESDTSDDANSECTDLDRDDIEKLIE